MHKLLIYKRQKLQMQFAEKPIRAINSQLFLVQCTPTKKIIYKTYCRFSGAGHSVYQCFNIQTYVRKYAGFGYIPGIVPQVGKKNLFNVNAYKNTLLYLKNP